MQVVNLFKRAIEKQGREGKPSRVVHLFGYLNRAEPLRKWFLSQYPTPSEYIHFIHDHPNHFLYDQETGSISVNNQPRAVSKKADTPQALDTSAPNRSGYHRH